MFQKGDYMIGNAVLYPRGICHSFVLIYDPWDGSYDLYPAGDVFDSGISTALGSGTIKWIQYIM